MEGGLLEFTEAGLHPGRAIYTYTPLEALLGALLGRPFGTIGVYSLQGFYSKTIYIYTNRGRGFFLFNRFAHSAEPSSFFVLRHPRLLFVPCPVLLAPCYWRRLQGARAGWGPPRIAAAQRGRERRPAVLSVPRLQGMRRGEGRLGVHFLALERLSCPGVPRGGPDRSQGLGA